jgi:hypothetical protein
MSEKTFCEYETRLGYVRDFKGLASAAATSKESPWQVERAKRGV